MKSIQYFRKNLKVAALLALSLAACAKNGDNNQSRAGIDPALQVRAPNRPDESFSVAGPIDNTHLGIKKAALEKEFLLSASIIPQTGAPTSSGLNGRVVAFKRYENSVYLLEATQGHVVTQDLPASLILAELPIVRETNDLLVLDFNRGMKNVFIAENWHASDEDSSDYGDKEPFKALSIAHSFIQSMRLSNHNLEIRQIAQINNGPKAQVPTVEVRYFLSPYLPDQSYVPRETSDFTRVGFFEVAPQLEANSGRTITRISKWNDKSPITFHISANTPAEYVQAIKEGVLYWNKVFGRDIVRAEVAPAGATAPDPAYNIIQWVPWDDAGMAYADALMDPRSGEILHAQIYLTSAFSFGARERAAALLRRLRSEQSSNSQAKTQLGIRFLKSSRICDYDAHANIADSLEILLASGTDDAAFLKLAQDYVRTTASHEVGHTLGLRHNFAGSLASDFSLEERDETFRKYLLEGTLPDSSKIVSSSVMEYPTFEDDILISARLMDRALPYDAAAVQWAYEGKELGTNSPYFCTDSQTGLYLDCLRFDSGSDPIAFNQWTVSTTVSQMPIKLVEAFIAAKTATRQKDRKPLERVLPNPSAVIEKASKAVGLQAMWFGETARSIKIERDFPAFGSLYTKAALEKRWQWIAKLVEQAGGIDRTLFSLLPASDRESLFAPEKAMNALDAYLSRPDVRAGITADGSTYTLSDDEIAIIRQTAKTYFEQVNTDLLDAVLDQIAKAKFEEPSTAQTVESQLAAIAEKIVFEKTGKIIEGNLPKESIKAQPTESWWPRLLSNTPDSSPTKMSAPEYKYPLQTRIKAIHLLSSSLGELIDFSLDGRTRLSAKLKGEIEQVIGKSDKDPDLTKLPRAIRQWVLEQQKVLAGI